jgi:hypothetical protein
MKMDKKINHCNLDKVFNLFCNFYPFGVNFFSLTSRYNFDVEELEAIYDFLVEEGLIENWGALEDKHILSEQGIELKKNQLGIEDYINCYTVLA